MNLHILSRKVFIGSVAAILISFGLLSYNYGQFMSERNDSKAKIEINPINANRMEVTKMERNKFTLHTVINEQKSKKKYASWKRSGINKSGGHNLLSHQGKENEYKKEDYSTSTEESSSDAPKISYKVLSDKEISNDLRYLVNASVKVAKRFDDRRQRIHELCQTSPYENTQSKKSFKNIVSTLANGRLIWCQVPKVGTTFLKYLRSTVDTLENDAKRKRSKNVSTEQTMRFFLVREPYSRLISGYVCKIVLTASFWIPYGVPIVKRFRTEPQEASVKCGNDVTFPEFIKYFIYSQEKVWHRNLHFVPIHEQCNICKTHYDYVGHLETFKDDFRYILQSVNVSVDFNMNHDEREIKGKARGIFKNKKIRDRCESKCIALRKAWWSFHVRGFVSKEIEFPLSQNCSSISSEEFAEISWSAHLRSAGTFDKAKQKREAMIQLYRQVPLSDRLKLREILRKDFDMFGYDPQPADLFPEMDMTV